MIETLVIVVTLALMASAFVALLAVRSAGKPQPVVMETLQKLDANLRIESATSRSELANELARTRDENSVAITRLNASLEDRVRRMDETVAGALDRLYQNSDQRIDLLRRDLLERQDRIREEAETNRRTLREEIATSLKSTSDALVQVTNDFSNAQRERMETLGHQVATLVTGNDARFETLRGSVDTGLAAIRDRNAEQLEQMRRTVDEKLQGTLDQRLGESFKQVSEHLEQVHRGLGEMKSLATSVGDFKRVLTNVKSRGGWGEVQLGALLDQILAPEQYRKNLRVREDSQHSVEFAICLPAHGDRDSISYVPIDAKFPMEDYQRLVEAQERGDKDAVDSASQALEQRIDGCAKDISEKYINPPFTTNFAFMYLPNEGLFAEAVRRPGLIEKLQRDYRVAIAGPTTLAANLNMIQMGFRTLAIERQSTEVWNLLGAVKTQFAQFGGVLDKVKKQINTASNSIDDVGIRTRAIQKRLRLVEELPAEEATLLLPEAALPDDEAENSD